MFKKRFKNYVSPIDQFLARFDQTHKLSRSQQAEIDKYKRIEKLRDHASKEAEPKSSEDFWVDF